MLGCGWLVVDGDIIWCVWEGNGDGTTRLVCVVVVFVVVVGMEETEGVRSTTSKVILVFASLLKSNILLTVSEWVLFSARPLASFHPMSHAFLCSHQDHDSIDPNESYSLPSVSSRFPIA